MPAGDPDASDPMLLDALGDVEAMGLWEVVRSQRSPITLTELADLTGIPIGQVQSSLDRLAGAGLVRTVRARKPRNSVGWASTLDRLVIIFDQSDPEIMARIKEVTRRWERHTDDLILNHGDRTSDPRTVYRSRYFGIDRLDREDMEELRRRIDRVCEFWNMLASKNGEQHPSGRRVRRGNHVISIRVEPLARATLPMAEAWFRPRDQAKRATAPDDSRARKPRPLTAREQEVASALAAGLQRKSIAAHLGVSIHTLTTMCKRIYAKLGVHSQAELAAVMRAPSPPPRSLTPLSQSRDDRHRPPGSGPHPPRVARAWDPAA